MFTLTTCNHTETVLQPIHLVNEYLIFQVAVEEFEERLEQCHNKGVEDAEVATKASKATARTLKDSNRSPHKTPGECVTQR